MYKIALMQAEIWDVRAAKKALSKRRRAKKKKNQRLRQGESLSVQDAQDLQVQRG